MKNLQEEIVRFCTQHQLIKERDHILVAVSGGVDSVVLLHLLVQMSSVLQLKLDVIHVNHSLRGEEADRDQAFVEKLSEKYKLRCFSRKLNVPKYIERKGLSEEDGARILRYRFFEQILSKKKADSVALGHHANDQVETVIDHFLRGSGLRGLSGMAAKRDQFIRPLLFAKRCEIETYAALNSLDYIIDSTNELSIYKRNRIRSDLIPYLKKELNPGLEEVVLRTVGIMRETEEYLNQNAKLSFETCLINQKKNKIILEIDSFLNYFIVIQKYIIYQILDRLEIHRSFLSSRTIDRILKIAKERISGKKISITSHAHVLVDHGQLVFRRYSESQFEFPVQPGIDYPLKFGENIFRAEVLKRDRFSGFATKDSNIEFIDADKIKGRLVIRNFRDGDRFRPLNFPGQKKVSNYFTDSKVPLHLRPEIPLLECDAGILWIIGYQIDDRFKITKNTERIMKLQIKRNVLND